MMKKKKPFIPTRRLNLFSSEENEVKNNVCYRGSKKIGNHLGHCARDNILMDNMIFFYDIFAKPHARDHHFGMFIALRRSLVRIQDKQ